MADRAHVSQELLDFLKNRQRAWVAECVRLFFAANPVRRSFKAKLLSSTAMTEVL